MKFKIAKRKLKIPILDFKFCGLSLFLFAICYLLFAIITVVPAAQAQTFSLSISPPLLELMIMPGKSYTQIYSLTNSGQTLTLTPSISAFAPDGPKGNLKFTSQPDASQALSFTFADSRLQLNQPFILEAKETKEISLKITASPTAPEKDYYFTLLFSSRPAGGRTNTGSQAAGVIGTNILITVSQNGQPVKKGEIEEFKLTNCYIQNLLGWCLLDSFSQPKYAIRLKNTGKTFWKPFGQITAKGLFNQEWQNELRPDNILAFSEREISLATPSAQPSFLIGSYRTSLEFQTDQEGEKISNTLVFFSMPVKGITALLLIAVLFKIIGSKLKSAS